MLFLAPNAKDHRRYMVVAVGGSSGSEGRQAFMWEEAHIDELCVSLAPPIYYYICYLYIT